MVLVFFGMVCHAMSKKKPVCVVRSFAQGIIHAKNAKYLTTLANYLNFTY